MKIEIFEFLDESLALDQAQSTLFIIIKYLLLICLALVAIVSLYYAFVKNRPLSPDQAFDLRLLQLKKDLKDPMFSQKDFFFEYISLLKFYIKEKMYINLDPCTDDEIIPTLENNNFEKDLVDALKPLLNKSFYVRFAEEKLNECNLQESIDWLESLKKYVILKKDDGNSSMCNI